MSGGEIPIRLLVAATPAAIRAAEERADTIESLVRREVERTNGVHERSGTGVGLVAAGFLSVPEPRGTDAAAALAGFTESLGANGSEVQKERERLHAPLVVLVGGLHLDALGKAYVMGDPSPGFAPWATSLVRVDGLWRDTWTLAHETAHNFGADHDPDHVEDGDRSGPGHAYEFEARGRRWKTLLSMGPGERLPIFSNPRLSHHDVAAGRPGTEDNAGVIRANRRVVSGFA